MDKICGFNGEYRWLSNFYRCCVVLDELGFTSVEHAYQAAKTLDLSIRHHIWLLQTAGDAKKFSKVMIIRDDWDSVKLSVMTDLVSQKFSYPSLKEKLLSTGNAYLEETNYWGDVYWGVCKGVGENNLGKIIMKIRESLI